MDNKGFFSAEVLGDEDTATIVIGSHKNERGKFWVTWAGFDIDADPAGLPYAHQIAQRVVQRLRAEGAD